jgi:hypothetical protein
MRRLDRAAGQLNPFLLAVAIGLVVVYAISLVGLILKLPVTHVDVCVQTAPPATTQEMRAK